MLAALTGTAWPDSAHLVKSANYANHNHNDDDERFKSYSKASLVLVHAGEGWGVSGT